MHIIVPQSNLHSKGSVKIPPSSIGVYEILSADMDSLYIGKSKNLRARVNSHLNGSSNIREFSNLFSYVRTYNCETEVEASLLEIYLIDKNKPILNKEFSYNSDESVQRKKLLKLNKNPFNDYWALSQFTSRKEFYNTVNNFVYYYSNDFSIKELQVLEFLKVLGCKVYGVVFAKKRTMLKLLDNDHDIVISKRTLDRYLNKYCAYGIISKVFTTRKIGGNGSNIYVFNKNYAEVRAKRSREVD